jgi:protein SCO1
VRTRVLLVVALLLVAVGGLAVYLESRPVVFHGTTYDPPMAAPHFILLDHNFNRVRLSDFRGHPVLLFFGYTNCPDVCPLTLSTLASTLRSIGARAGEVQVMMVTVDPERDTVETLARYVQAFGPGVRGLTGSPDALQSLRNAYGVHARVVPAAEGDHSGHEMVAHTDVVFGIDSQGDLRVLLRPLDPESGLEEDLRTLLRL